MKALEKAFKAKHLAVLAISVLMVAALLGLAGCGSSDNSSSNSSSSNADDKYANLEATTLIMADNTGKGAAGNLWG